MAAPALPWRRGGAGATGRDSLSHTSRYRACHVARVPRRRGRVLCGETRREVGETPGMPAGRTGGAGMVEGSARPDHTRTCLQVTPRRGAGDVAGRPGGMGATMPRERHHERGALAGRDRTTWARGHHAGTVGPGESVTGGTSGGNAPDGGLTVTATGPSRQCRCRDGPLWGVTRSPGYAGGSILCGQACHQRSSGGNSC